MEENDFTLDEDIDLDSDTEDSEEAVVEENNEQTQKPKESDDARATRLLRQTNQARKKLGLPPLKDSSEEPKVEAKPNETKSDGLDYGQKAYLVANGIKGKDEIALVQEYMENGKDLEEIIDNRHFQNDLKDLRDGNEAKAAIPNTTKRTGAKTQDSVDYWLAKPFSEVPDTLKTKVLNARIAREKGSNSSFSSNPIIAN